MNSPRFSPLRALLTTGTFTAVVLIVLVAGSDSPFGIAPAQSAVNPVQVVQPQAVKYEDYFEVERSFVGQIEAQQSSDLGFELSGTLDQIYFDEGERVGRGDSLAQLDRALIEARRDQAQAELERALAEARLAASTHRRIEEVWRANAISDQEFDEAKEAIRVTNAAVRVAQAQLQSIDVELRKTELLAPFDAVVIKRTLDQGTVVMPGQSVLRLQQVSELKARIGLTTQAADQLTAGDSVSLSINGVQHSATLQSILPLRTSSRTVDAIFKLSGQEAEIRPGDTVRLKLPQIHEKRGFWLPFGALREGQRGLWSVYAVSEDLEGNWNVERRALEVHHLTSDRAYVSGAISEGELIVLRGADKLVPGQQVRFEKDSEGQGNG